MRDNNDSIIDIGTSIVNVTATYDGTTPLQIHLDGSYRGDFSMHKGMGYTFRITESVVDGIKGTDIIFYTQANPSAGHVEYTTNVFHFDYHATIYITHDAPDNLKFGIRDGNTNTAIDGSGGSVVYSDQSGGAEKLLDSDAVFLWNGSTDVWETGADEGLKSSSGKLILGDTTITTSTNTLSFATQTTLDNVLLDAGNYS